MISGVTTYLRPALLCDTDHILAWENDPELWPFTETSGPFSKTDIMHFIQESNDLFANGQLRLMIIDKISDQPIGALDIFDFNTSTKKAGIGILIGEKSLRKKGFATDALRCFLSIAASDLKIRTLECIIYPDNVSSLKLFENCGFRAVGMEFFKENRVIRYRYSN
jgi:diamine N-acetyltransferase